MERSLLDVEDFPRRLNDWLQRQPAGRSVLIVGGGKLADELRNVSQRHKVGDEIMHWLCIESMCINAKWVAELLPECCWCNTLEQAKQASVGSWAVLDVVKFLREEEPRASGNPLPVGWHVTSDSIAARVAELCDGSELVLLKSCLPKEGWTPESLAQEGVVDAHFPQAAKQVRRIRCVNIRGEWVEESLWGADYLGSKPSSLI